MAYDDGHPFDPAWCRDAAGEAEELSSEVKRRLHWRDGVAHVCGGRFAVVGAEAVGAKAVGAEVLSIKAVVGDDAGTATTLSSGKARIAKVLAGTAQSVVMPKPVEDDFTEAMRRPMTDADRAELAKPPHLRRSDPEIDAFLDRAFPADDAGARVPDFHGPARDPAPTPASIARAQARAESKRLFGLYPLLMDEHLRKLDFGVTTIDETVDAFAKMRKADRKADKTTADHDIKALRSVLEKQQQRIDEEFALRKSMEDQERIDNGPTKIDRLKVSDKVKAMVRQSPALFDMVNRNPALAEQRLQRMAKRFRGKNFNVKRFEQGWYDYYVSNQLVVTSEHDALFIAGKLSRTPRFPVDAGTPLDIIKGGGRGNKHGIDAIAVELPDPNAPPPQHAETHVIDDKALMADTVSSVTALTKFLEGNFRTDAAEIKARLAEHRASNIPVNPLHEMAADQLLRAADAIRTLKKQPGFAGDKKVWQDPAYAKAVQQILRDNHIHMAITSARGSVVKVSELLGKDGYGFKLLFDRP